MVFFRLTLPERLKPHLIRHHIHNAYCYLTHSFVWVLGVGGSQINRNNGNCRQDSGPVRTWLGSCITHWSQLARLLLGVSWEPANCSVFIMPPDAVSQSGSWLWHLPDSWPWPSTWTPVCLFLSLSHMCSCLIVLHDCCVSTHFWCW